MHQDATWYRGRPQRRGLCVRWGPSPPPQKGGRVPQFSAHDYCGHMAGCIKMPLGMDVGLIPGDFVFDGNPAPPKKGKLPIFGPCLLRPNGWMDQDATWYEGKPRPDDNVLNGDPAPPAKRLDRSKWHLAWRWALVHRPDCARWGRSSPPQKGSKPPPICGPFELCQTAGCIKIPLGMEVGLSPGDFVLDRNHAPPPQKGGGAPPQNFRPMFIVAKRLDGSTW